jgi:hypothetical protein
VISLSDNSEVLLRSWECFPAGWSPDGSLLYDACGNNMPSIPASHAGRGAAHTAFTIPEDIDGASISADGKLFVFSAEETKSDVWVVDNFDPAYRK